MGKYKIKDKEIKSNTDSTVAISQISYEVENAEIHGVSHKEIKRQIDSLKNKDKFPSNLKYVDSFYDKNSGLSGVAFQDTKTGKVTIGFAGTNLDGSIKDTIDDVDADAKIVAKAYDAEEDYFKESDQFINRINKKYSIDTMTGHSKGGRDCTIMGMKYQVPNIITYNSAPLYSSGGTNLFYDIASASKLGINSVFKAISSLLKIPAKMNMNDLKKLEEQYTGNIVNYVSTDDILNSITRKVKSHYPGISKFIYIKGAEPSIKGHGIGKFNDVKDIKEVKSFIQYDNETITEVQKQELKLLKDVKKQLKEQGTGGLTESQKIFLDAAEALIYVANFKSLIQDNISSLNSQLNKYIEDTENDWKEVKQAVNKINEATPDVKLTDAEIQEALNEVGCTKNVIVTKPVAKYKKQKSKLKKIEKDLQELMDQITKVINEQVETDTELAGMFQK